MKRDPKKPGNEVERLRRELRSCEERFHNIIQRSADGILIVGHDGRVRFANPAAEALFDRPREDLDGTMFGYPIVAGETAELDIITRGKAELVTEMRVVDTDWQGEPAFLATLRNITARKRLERDLQRALAESEEARDRIDGIVRSIAEGLIVTDNENRVALMNRAAERMLGVFCQEVVGQSVERLFLDYGCGNEFLAGLKDNAGDRFDLAMPGRDSQHSRILQVWNSVLRDKKESRVGMVTVLQDVTREREIERMKSEFVTIAAHELRSPLTSIIGFSELILSRPGPFEEQKEHLAVIKKQALVLSEIVHTLLDISRIEAGQEIPLKMESSTAEEIISQAGPFIRTNSGKFRFEINLQEGSTVLIVDQKKIHQVLENLLSNAVKYSPRGGTISVSGEPLGEKYQFSVVDQGIGMTEDQVQRVFDKFYRADNSNTAVGGLGLGMNIARNIVESHGGKIWVESVFGQGTAVRFTLPAIRDEKTIPDTTGGGADGEKAG